MKFTVKGSWEKAAVVEGVERRWRRSQWRVTAVGKLRRRRGEEEEEEESTSPPPFWSWHAAVGEGRARLRGSTGGALVSVPRRACLRKRAEAPVFLEDQCRMLCCRETVARAAEVLSWRNESAAHQVQGLATQRDFQCATRLCQGCSAEGS